MRGATLARAALWLALAGPSCGGDDDSTPDADALDGADLDAETYATPDADASDPWAWQLCRGTTTPPVCTADYDPGCPAATPEADSPCTVGLGCDYCRGGVLVDSATHASCVTGRWDLHDWVCDPPAPDGGDVGTDAPDDAAQPEDSADGATETEPDTEPDPADDAVDGPPPDGAPDPCVDVEPGSGGEGEPCSKSIDCDGSQYCNRARCRCFPPGECVEPCICFVEGHSWTHDGCVGFAECTAGLCEWTCT